MKKLIVLVALSAAAAGASTISGTLGWAPTTNTVAFTGATLGSATSVTIPALESINELPALYLGVTNGFAALVALGGGVAIADATLSVSNINGGFFGDSLPNYAEFAASNRFEFDVTSAEWTTSAATNLSLLVDGTLVDHLGVFSPTAAAVSGSFTTTGAGAVNASFTLTTAAAVPEPATAALIGLALCAIGLRPRLLQRLFNRFQAFL